MYNFMDIEIDKNAHGYIVFFYLMHTIVEENMASLSFLSEFLLSPSTEFSCVTLLSSINIIIK